MQLKLAKGCHPIGIVDCQHVGRNLHPKALMGADRGKCGGPGRAKHAEGIGTICCGNTWG